MKKYLSIFGLAALGLSLVLTSCGESAVTPSSEADEHTHITANGVVTTGYEDVHVDDASLQFKGTHRFDYERTAYPLLKKGTSTYTVLVPDGATSEILTARDELIYFFAKATGVTLPWRYDKTMEYDANGDYISLGDTVQYAGSGLNFDKDDLTLDGAAIKTVNHTIYCYGGSSTGVIYAVYDFLKIYFHYEVYSPDVYEIDKNVHNLSLYDFDVYDIPDIKERSKNYGFMNPTSGNYDQTHFGTRVRMTRERVAEALPVYREWDCQGTSATSTNTNTYIPYDLFVADHPKWFSDHCESSKYQLCYTAHGDAEEKEALITAVVRKMTDTLKAHPVALFPDNNLITFTMEDNHNICDCEDCTACVNKYGTEISPLILFVNEVGKRIDAWMNLEENAAYSRPSFKIIYFAYNQYTDAPVKRVDGGFAPTYDEIKLYKNTGVYLAIMDRFDYQYSAFDNPIQSGGVTADFTGIDTINSWSALTDSIYLWTYQTNFGHYGYFYDSFSFYNQPFYNYLASRNLKMFFAQGQDTSASGDMGTTWNNLKVYLNSKLSWDSTLDETTLVDRYFVAMYGKAASAMRNFFNAMRAHYSWILESNAAFTCARSIYNAINKREYYPLATLQSFQAMGDEALKLIVDEDYPTGEAEIYRMNIEAEIFSALYIQIELYDMDLSVATKREIGNRMLNDVSWLRLTSMRTRESGGSYISDIAKSAIL